MSISRRIHPLPSAAPSGRTPCRAGPVLHKNHRCSRPARAIAAVFILLQPAPHRQDRQNDRTSGTAHRAADGRLCSLPLLRNDFTVLDAAAFCAFQECLPAPKCFRACPASAEQCAGAPASEKPPCSLPSRKIRLSSFREASSISLTVLDAFQESCCTENKEGFPDLFTARSAVVRGKSFSFILL